MLPLPGAAAAVAGLLVLAAVAFWAFTRVEEHRPWRAAMVTVGLALAVIGISYPWYALLLVPLVALDGRARWLAIAAAAYPAYLAPALGWSLTAATAGAYGVALAMIMVTAWEPGTRLAGPRPSLDSG